MKTPDTIMTITDPLTDVLGYELRRASIAVMASLTKELEPLGLRPSEATMLVVIGANPGCTQSDIARALRAKPANLVPLINSLLKAGAVERVPGEGRALCLSLTEAGTQLHGQVRAAMARHEARITRRLSPDQQRQMIEVLRLVCKDACCDHSD